MTANEPPTARRMRRPGWRDPRLGVGVALVAASVALGVWAVRDAGATEPVYATAEAVMPGAVVQAEDLVLREVRLGEVGDHYLRPGELEGAATMLRAIGPGELLPRGAVGQPGATGMRPLVVELDGALPTQLPPGTSVDLWRLPSASSAREEAEHPALVVEDVIIAEVLDDDGMFLSGRATAVELLIPGESLAEALAAVAAEGSLVVVPVAPSGGGIELEERGDVDTVSEADEGAAGAP